MKPNPQNFTPQVDPPDMFDYSGSFGRFNAIHMSLIPRGTDQGKLLVWAAQNPWRQTAPEGIYYGSPAGQRRVIFWSILDPQTQQFLNFMAELPLDLGDLFCAGHVWSDDGNLIVMGGTGAHGGSGTGNGWEGSKLAYLYDPGIRFDPNILDAARWYPTVLDLGRIPQTTDRNLYLVLGGTHNGTAVNTYQAWVDGPSAGTRSWQLAVPNPPSNTFAGPGGGNDYELGDYPRAHLTSAGRGVTAGMVKGSAYNEHHSALPWNQKWLSVQWQQATHRTCGSSVLFPISLLSGLQDRAVSMGGFDWVTSQILASVQQCNIADTGNPTWAAFAPLNHARWLLNSVLLPDGTLLAIGGEKTSPVIHCSEVPAAAPELYAGGTWTPMATSDIPRNYHSTAILLPDATVLVAGGEWRKWQPTGFGNCRPSAPADPMPVPHAVDYEIYQPPYLFRGPRPVISPTSPPGSAWSWSYGASYEVGFAQMPLGVEVTRAVLVRPGSVTHHSDGNQRVVELFVDASAGDNSLLVNVPANNYLLPRGYYMLFLLTDQGVPSVAAWVRVV